MRGRLVSVTALSAFALIAGGCHRKTVSAYQPPPPPATSTGANRGGRGLGSTDSTAAIPPPAPMPNSFGKPVSTEVGLASWYGPPYAGRKGADGTVYDQNAMTAAHLTLPMGTMVRVTNLATNQAVVVKITDRGPFVRGRIIDLSLAAAKATGVYRAGVAKVKVEAFAAPMRANADLGGRWCVQIGAFSRESDAVKLKADLLRRYATAKVIEFPGPTGYWVRVNPKFPDKKNATEVADGIHPKDPAAEPYLIRTD
jgi:peptidoglycan lytic transglycosylase